MALKITYRKRIQYLLRERGLEYRWSDVNHKIIFLTLKNEIKLTTKLSNIYYFLPLKFVINMFYSINFSFMITLQ